MNRLILRYGSQVTIVILAIFTWVIYRRVADGGVAAIIPLAVTGIAVWVVGAFVFVYFWPRLTVASFKRVIVKHGLGGGPIPVNQLYAVPERPSQSASTSSVMATGTDDLLYLCGWLDLKDGPRLLHVPEMSDRYYSMQFTDPSSGANFAYVGKRTTGTEAGTFLLCEAMWKGDTPAGMTRVEVPHRTALLIGRVYVANETDRPLAYALAQQIRLSHHSPDPF